MNTIYEFIRERKARVHRAFEIKMIILRRVQACRLLLDFITLY